MMCVGVHVWLFYPMTCQEIDKYAPAVVNKMLVGTKTDLVSKRVVP